MSGDDQSALIADLHAHTRFSDGKESPAQLMSRAKSAGVRILAVTDHDTVTGLAESRTAAQTAGLELIPGLELSVRCNSVEAHIVGLWINDRDPELLKLTAMLEKGRAERAKKMVDKLAGLGARVAWKAVEKIAGPGVVGRPHVAQALVDAGQVPSFQEAFYRYIGRRGPAYAPKPVVRPEQAIAAIHAAGGVAVMAHPLVGGVQREQVAMIAEMGLDAVEVIHPKLSEAESDWLRELARQKGLALSGGSDWHGEGWSEGEMGRFCISREWVAELHARRRINQA